MQIGTMIVLEQPEEKVFGNRTGYRMKSHSHPVVSYGSRENQVPLGSWRPNMWSEGIVWDYAELKDVFTLCFNSQKEIRLEALMGLSNAIRMIEAQQGVYRFRLSSIKNDLKQFGIGMPSNLKNMKIPESDIAQVRLIKQMQPEIVDILGFGMFHASVRFGDTDEMVREIRRQVADYQGFIQHLHGYDLTDLHLIRITYMADSDECKELVEILNNGK